MAVSHAVKHNTAVVHPNQPHHKAAPVCGLLPDADAWSQLRILSSCTLSSTIALPLFFPSLASFPPLKPFTPLHYTNKANHPYGWWSHGPGRTCQQGGDQWTTSKGWSNTQTTLAQD